MEYKQYTNEEVKTWTVSPRRITERDLEYHFADGYGELHCLTVLDYVDNAFKPQLELQVRPAFISKAYKDCGGWVVEFTIEKALNERSDIFDRESDIYIKHFDDMEFFDINVGFLWRTLLAMAPHVLMQRSDNRMLILNNEYQPQWLQDWYAEGGDYTLKK